MADITKSVEVIFSTGLEGDGAAIASFGSGLDEFATKAGAVVGPLNTLADTVKIVDAAIVGLGLALVGQALEAAGKFNQSITEVGTLTGATADQVNSLGAGVLDYSKTSSQSLDSVTDAIYKAVSSGVALGDSIEFIATAEQLAIAGRADLSAVTIALTGTMNAYGAGVDQATAYSDLFVKTVQKGQTTMPELAASISQVTGIAAAGKVPFNEITAAIAALTASGVPTSEAMTSLKAAISNIINPSKEAADTAKTLGISFDANALAGKGLSGVFADVYAKTGGNITQINSLFGSMEGLKAVTLLGADASGKYADALAAMKDSAGATEEAAKALSKTWENVTQNLTNNINAVLVTAGTKLGPEFTNIITNLAGVFNTVQIEMKEGAFDSVFATLNKFSADIAALFATVAANIPAALEQVNFSKFNDALINLADSLGGIFKGVDLTTPEGLAKAIQLVVDSIATLINIGAGIADTWAALFQKAQPLIEQFAKMSQESATTKGQFLGLADVLNVLLPAFSALGNGINAIGTAMEVMAGTQVVKLIGSLGSASASFLTTGQAAHGLGVVLGVAGATTGLTAAAGAAGYGIGTLLNDGLNAVIGKLSGGNSLGTLIFELTHGTEELGAAATTAAPALDEVAQGAGNAAVAAEGLREAVAVTNTGLLTVGGNLTEAGVAAQKWANEQVTAASKTEFLSAASAVLAEQTAKVDTATKALATSLASSSSTTQKGADHSAAFAAELGKIYDISKVSADGIDGVANKTSSLVSEFKTASASTADLTQTSLALAEAQGTVVTSTEIYAGAASKSDTAIASFSQTVSKSRQEMNEAAKAYLEAADAAGYNEKAHALVRAEFEKLDAASVKNVTSTTSFKDALASATTAAKGGTKELLEITKAAGDYEIKMTQIAANTAIKVIEAKMKLDIADVEANAKIAVAILDSIAKTYESDTDLIADLLDQVTDGYSTADQIRIKMAEEANKRVEELHTMQMKVIQAQVDYLYAKTAAVVNGDPIMTINADGLEPALEAFMWEVLKKIQVKMAMDGANAIIGGIPVF